MNTTDNPKNELGDHSVKTIDTEVTRLIVEPASSALAGKLVADMYLRSWFPEQWNQPAWLRSFAYTLIAFAADREHELAQTQQPQEEQSQGTSDTADPTE